MFDSFENDNVMNVFSSYYSNKNYNINIYNIFIKNDISNKYIERGEIIYINFITNNKFYQLELEKIKKNNACKDETCECICVKGNRTKILEILPENIDRLLALADSFSLSEYSSYDKGLGLLTIKGNGFEFKLITRFIWNWCKNMYFKQGEFGSGSRKLGLRLSKKFITYDLAHIPQFQFIP